jgi:hypothetical protein
LSFPSRDTNHDNWYSNAREVTLGAGKSELEAGSNSAGRRSESLRRDQPEAIHDGHAQWLGQLKSRLERFGLQTAGQRQ